MMIMMFGRVGAAGSAECRLARGRQRRAAIMKIFIEDVGDGIFASPASDQLLRGLSSCPRLYESGSNS